MSELVADRSIVRRALPLLASVAAALALGACGKKGPSPTTTTPPPTTSAPATTPAPEADAAAPAPAPDAAAPAPAPDAAAPAPAEADAAAPTVAAEADAAVAPPAPTGPATEVTLWHAYRAGEAEAFEKAIADYNASQSEVVIKPQAVPYDAFVDKITITVPQGQGPDLFIFAHNMVGPWVDKGVLEPLSGKVDGEFLKQFLPDSVRALVYQKNLYGLPLAMKSLVMFYNKKLLPNPPATMEELVAALKPLQTDERVGIAYQAAGLYFHAMWIYAFGGQIFDDAHNPAFDTPEQVKAIQYVRGLHFTDKVLPSGLSGDQVTNLFNAGNAVVVFNGPWFRPEIDEKAVDYGMATIPTVNGVAPKPMLGIESIFVTKTSTKKEAALKAAMYLAGAASAEVRMKVGKQPVCHAATLEKGAAEDPAMKVFLEQAKNAVLMDSTPQMQILWTPADIAIGAGVFVEDRKPEVELKKAQAKMVSDIAKMGK
ncbi:MAG: extracellular solute-binding protein [Myxococcota bacterium]